MQTEGMVYNNFGEAKITDSPNVIGYLNFKCKCVIDGKTECLRIAVQMQKGGKFYYDIEVNKKPQTPQKSPKALQPSKVHGLL